MVVPVLNPKWTDQLATLASGLGPGGVPSDVILLGIVPESADPGHDANEARLLRRKLARLGRGSSNPGRVLVRSAPTFDGGVRSAIADERADALLLGWNAGETDVLALIADPPCDTLVCRPHSGSRLRRVLLAVRGGPYAELALEVGLNIGRPAGAELTLMHIERPEAEGPSREREQRLFQELLLRCSEYRRVNVLTLTADDPAEAILAEAANHDLLILGAGIRPDDSHAGLGPVPERVLAKSVGGTIVVKAGNPVDPTIFEPPAPSIDLVVNRWFTNNTFHCREFNDLAGLVAVKERLGLSVSLAIMATGNSEGLPGLVENVRGELQERNSLLDEIAVFAVDDEAQLPLQDLGVPVLPATGDDAGGPGRALWQSLRELRGDIVAWIDGDVRNSHARMVYGVVGPLLLHERLQYVKGFYERPLSVADAAFGGDGRLPITELTARPLLNLFFPELSGVVEPLCREHAVRRSAIAEMPIFAGQGVEVGLLIDFLERFGLDAIAQSDLERRVGQDLSVDRVTRKAFDVIQVMINRIGRRRDVDLLSAAHQTMKLILQDGEQYHIEQVEAGERELPPAGAVRDASMATS